MTLDLPVGVDALPGLSPGTVRTARTVLFLSRGTLPPSTVSDNLTSGKKGARKGQVERRHPMRPAGRLIPPESLTAPGFRQSVQAVVAAGCTYDNNADFVHYKEIAGGGRCARRVIGAGYRPARAATRTSSSTRDGRGASPLSARPSTEPAATLSPEGGNEHATR
jgi:hypothetical protein